ncbi:Fic family protein (plasmid) [Ligilactobacillus salivarius]|uniref:Fic family protein n=1 Tax=Ligilactobacillus salivarius TaxID=1624 RepID=UPI00263BA22A|nr:Fic family protein [Ligilactobacillus salivarius]MDN4849065.1 Fic family protein [Ligilactobacillus salivarius]
MSKDNTALANFITSLGSLNSYGSTVLQTKKALDTNSTKPLRQDNDDVAIYTDALNGIKAIQKIGFTVDGIIAINKEFKSNSEEEPNMPGHLRNAYYNEDDRIAIIVDQNTQQAYYPPEVISRMDLENIVNEFNGSEKTEEDAWKVFAKLSKLQPFQDGNKRTALIAANAALNTWAKENYLVLPFNDLDRVEFSINLMRYYIAADSEEENKAFKKMISTLPTQREVLLHKPISDDLNELDNVKTTVIKSMFRKHKDR